MAGRPKKYTPEKINELAKSFLTWATEKYNAKQVFWFKDWAIDEGFTWEMISRFADENEQFNHTLKRVKLMQESVLVKSGLSKKSNPAFIIFTLKNVSGWRDQQYLVNEQFQVVIDWQKVSLEQIDRLRRGENPLNVLTPEQYTRVEAKK